MRKKEFVKALARKFPGLSEEQVERMCNQIFGALTNTLRDGGRIEIRGFGSFFVRHRDKRLLRSPRTGEMMEIPAKRIPRFKAGKELKQKVNNAAASPPPRP